MSEYRRRMFRITLWGVNGEPVPLSRPGIDREGIFLREVPDGLQGFAKKHLWDEASGTWRGMAPQINDLTLDLHAKGGDIRGDVNRVLDALGDGSKPVKICVTSPEFGHRWLEMRMSKVSQIDWGQSPGSSAYAKFSVVLELAGSTAKRFKERLVLTQSGPFGAVQIPVDGDQDVWPKFVVSGQHGGVKIRLTTADDWQTVPYSAGGWVIDSHPARRSVTNLEGLLDFSQVVPFWPEPIPVTRNRGTIQIEVDAPGPDFRLEIEWQPEMSRAW